MREARQGKARQKDPRLSRLRSLTLHLQNSEHPTNCPLSYSARGEKTERHALATQPCPTPTVILGNSTRGSLQNAYVTSPTVELQMPPVVSMRASARLIRWLGTKRNQVAIRPWSAYDA